MAMKIIAIRIGNRYGPEYEKYLEEKLPEYEFIWIRKPIRDDVLLQWNKMYAMSLDIDEPVVVMDIDVDKKQIKTHATQRHILLINYPRSRELIFSWKRTET